MSVIKSPILHFLIIGFVAFILYTNLRPVDRETIHITTQTIDALVKQRESILQNPVTPEERKELIEDHIEDEILLREAYKRGFDKNDYRIRKRLLGFMRSSLTDVIPEPSVAQLRAFYEENRELYQTSPARSFEHVYFSFASSKQPENPDEFIRKLNRTSDVSKLGEFSSWGNKSTEAPFQMIANNFGKTFAEAVFEMPLNEWRGPIESFRGIHYVRVYEEHDPELPPFEQRESYLRQDYFIQKSRESQQQKIDDLHRNYEVIVEGYKTK